MYKFWHVLTSFVSRDRKWFMTIELQYYAKLRANFKFRKSENLLIWFKSGIIIDIQSFVDVSVMGRKRASKYLKALDVLSLSKFDFYVKLNS